VTDAEMSTPIFDGLVDELHKGRAATVTDPIGQHRATDHRDDVDQKSGTADN
jgi:hypothetical protein